MAGSRIIDVAELEGETGTSLVTCVFVFICQRIITRIRTGIRGAAEYFAEIDGKGEGRV